MRGKKAAVLYIKWLESAALPLKHSRINSVNVIKIEIIFALFLVIFFCLPVSVCFLYFLPLYCFYPWKLVTIIYYVVDDYRSAAQNPYFYLWIVFGFISSIYTYYWDVRMDWGLFETCCGENRFLREEIVYSSPVSYY